MAHKLIEEICLQLGSLLAQKKIHIAVAESCTGGMVSQYLTSIPGSSSWFDRGFVTYSNESKMDLLDVGKQTLSNFGAVSKETASEMALGALNKSRADITLSITGIAGPGGGRRWHSPVDCCLGRWPHALAFASHQWHQSFRRQSRAGRSSDDTKHTWSAWRVLRVAFGLWPWACRWVSGPAVQHLAVVAGEFDRRSPPTPTLRDALGDDASHPR